MKNIKASKFFRIVAFALSVIMLLACLPLSAYAAVKNVEDPAERLECIKAFNTSVNSIKTERPSFSYIKLAGLSDENDAISPDKKTLGKLSEDEKKYLMLIIDRIFNPRKSLFSQLFGVITGNNSEIETKKISKGESTVELLPKEGQKYISALSGEDSFALQTERSENRFDSSKNKSAVRIKFDDCSLEQAAGSAIEKIFDLPSGELFPSASEHISPEAAEKLKNLKLKNMEIKNAFVQALYGADGQLEKYEQSVSYTFALSFYDAIAAMGALVNIDFSYFVKKIVEIINTVRGDAGAGSDVSFDLEKILSENDVYFQYDVKLTLSDFDWIPRYFGDIDSNSEVNSYDARSILRCAVGLENINDQLSLIYADMDFDGIITASDARFALRTAVGLEEKFNTVPEGKTVKIIVLDENARQKI